jgi:hypothetical protein
MSDLDQIIDISISLSQKAITQAGFGTPMIMGESMKLSVRAKEYADISEVSDDFAESDIEYKMASLAFSQEKTPEKILIGKKVASASSPITSATRVGASGNNAKKATIVKAGSNVEVGATAVISGYTTTSYNGTVEIIEKISSDSYVVQYDSALLDATASGSGVAVISETASQAIQNIENYNSDWYCALMNSVVEADILSAASKIEAIKKLLIVRSNEVDNFDATDVGSILYQLNALKYNRTAFIYNSDVSTKFIDAAWAGRMLPTVPGSENWALKELIGIATDNLKSSQANGILLKKGNTYENRASRGVTRWGTAVSGEYIDIIRSIDWLKARLQENLFQLLISSEKVEFTDIGGDLIEIKMTEIFKEAVSNGLIAKNQEGNGIFTITIPPKSSISTADKLARNFSGIKFTAELAGAINTIGISGTLSV